MTDADRQRDLNARLRKIPNANLIVNLISADRVSFTVSSCRFVTLCHALNHPEPAPLFCAVDDVFFQKTSGLSLSREQTIARGGASCPFVLTRIDESLKPRLTHSCTT